MSAFDPLRTLAGDGTTASMNLNIRTATAADVRAMHRLRRNVLENRLSERTGIGEASYLPFICAGSAWVAESLNGIAGFAAVDAPTQRVWALFVDPNCERAGVGRALHEAMLAWCRDQGLQRLVLSTEADGVSDVGADDVKAVMRALYCYADHREADNCKGSERHRPIASAIRWHQIQYTAAEER